jgi:DNA-binding SARP family transcriptional activator
VRTAVDLYRGAFLDGEESALPQAAALAVSLRRRLVRHIAGVARQYEATDGPKAADWYEEGLRVDPCAEDISRSLMTVYHKLGRRAVVPEVYGRCRAALATRLGSAPSPETERLFKTLRPD